MATSVVTKEALSAMVLQGVVTLIFGVAAVFWPGLTLVTLLYLFSTFVLVLGILTMVRGFMDIGGTGSWFLEILLGFFELGIGIYLLRHPHVTFATFILLIGFALIARGIVDMVMAFIEGGRSASHRTLGFIVGAAALVAGIVVLFQPAGAGVAFVWILGLFALVTGPMELAMAHDIKKTLEV
jgi:uncharacterized membrane protein HdeD (DUF308 family)